MGSEALQAEPSPTNSELVELQRTLYTSRNPTRRWLHVSRRNWILDAISRYTGAQSRNAMEVGPGSGTYLPSLAQRFESVTTIDIEADYIDHVLPLCSHYTNLHPLVADIRDSGLADASFDFILCTEVIEHIVDAKRVLPECYRLLRPGGVLLLSTPQPFSTLEVCARIAFLPGIVQLVKLVYKEPVLELGHVNLMSPDELVRDLTAAGFSIAEQHKSGLYLPVIAELPGQLGLRMQQRLARSLHGTRLDWLLWTQYHVAIA